MFYYIVLVAALFSCSLQAVTTSELFEKVSPSVVLIDSEEGSGSGVVLTEKGKILTNLHVVNTPLPLSVILRVKSGGKTVEKEFNKIKLVKVHKKYDLAILQIEDLGDDLTLPLEQSKAQVRTGEQAYAIGNPGAGRKLRNTITSGLVSSAARDYEGLSYLQISVPINPGNSGGALINGRGQLTGITTFKIRNTENLGFAIPLTEVKERDFVALDKRPVNAKLTSEYIEYFHELIAHYNAEKDRAKKEVLLSNALQCLQESLNFHPGNRDVQSNIARIYEIKGEPELAMSYFRESVVNEPAKPGLLFHYGSFLFKKSKFKEAEAVLMKAVFRKAKGSAAAATVLAQLHNKEKRFDQAYFFAKMAFLSDNDASANSHLMLTLSRQA